MGMWKDFGGRQYGKSTRLAEHLLDYILTTPNRAVIVCKSRHMHNELIEKALKAFAQSVQCTSVEVYSALKADLKKRVRFSPKMIPLVRNYVDEVQLIKDKYLFMDEDSYYTATLYDDDWNGAQFVRVDYMTPFLKKFTRTSKIDRLLASGPFPAPCEFPDDTTP